MTSGIGAAQGRRETGGVFRDSHVWQAGCVDAEAAKGERRRNQWRAARQRFDGLDRDPVPGRGWQQNGRGVTISVMEVLDLDPSPEEPGMRLEQTGRTPLNSAVDIAEDLDRTRGASGKTSFKNQTRLRRLVELALATIIGSPPPGPAGMALTVG